MAHQQGRFFWKLFFGNVVLLVGVIGACVFLIADTFDSFYDEEQSNHLHTLAHVLDTEYGEAIANGDAERLALAAHEVGEDGNSAVRITFIRADGEVLGDSHAEPEYMESHAMRDEIRQAMATGMGESTRFSTTVDKAMKYVAMRVGNASNPAGVIRVAMPVGNITARTQAARRLFWRIALVILAAAVVLALGLAKMWSGRIARVTSTARLLSQGDLTARADDRGRDEVALLARSLNRMRDHQTVQLDTIEHHRRTLEYLLAKLHEGVLATDATGRIILMNNAAGRLLGIRNLGGNRDAGLTHQVADSATLSPQIAALLEPDRRRSIEGVIERELTIDGPKGPLTLLARASDIVLPDSSDSADAEAGRLLVLTDVTELTRTIQMKTDFVANASHELRTPLTAIRAAVDTLMTFEMSNGDGSAKTMLSVIDRHSERLNAIVADLLDLSRIESGRKRYESSRLQLSSVVAGLHTRFAERMLERKLDWRVEIADDADELIANEELLLLVLDNLVDNAIKFTDSGGWVSLTSVRDDEQVKISVADNGCGIATTEQDRVFERFYQVERARTGHRRGTGLGLAIVRHAMTAMNGRVVLASAPGEGTRIDLYLAINAGNGAAIRSATPARQLGESQVIP